MWGELPDRYLVAHVVPQISGEQLQGVSDCLLALGAAIDLDIVLMPITDCWDDGAAIDALRELAPGRLWTVPKGLSYEARALVVMSSAGFVGQSMHGAITAMAVGKPAVVVAPPPNNQKFVELFAQVQQPRWLVPSWRDAVARSGELTTDSRMERIAGLNETALLTYFRDLYATV